MTTSASGATPLLEFHPTLVEDAVLLAVRGRDAEPDLHSRRDPLYHDPDPERRERRFASLHFEWFQRLGLDRPFRRALEELREPLAPVRRILAVPATREKDEGAELFVSDEGDRNVVLRIGPRTVTDEVATTLLLRREFLHVADMLDPAFAYAPHLPRQPTGPAHDRRLQERYRVLWSCSVDGRLGRAGATGPRERAARLLEFREAFAVLGETVDDCFARIFDRGRPRHADLVALAADPRSALGLPGSADRLRCALCAFPTFDFEPAPGALPLGARALIISEFPAWTPAAPICLQCADLYRARAGEAGPAGIVDSAVAADAAVRS